MQAAFRDGHGLQCGFCTPGFVVSVTGYLRDHSDPGDDEIREALSGNLCRCTGYQGIIKAVGRRPRRPRRPTLDPDWHSVPYWAASRQDEGMLR